MAKYLIDVNLPYYFSLWKGGDFIHQRDIDDEWSDEQIWNYAREIMGLSNDREILLTSGFEVTSGKGPVNPIGMPEGPEYAYIPGVSGLLKLRWERSSVRDAHSFVIEQASTDPNNPQTTWVPVAFSEQMFLYS